MRYNVTVDIPYTEKTAYTLYAYGCKISAPIKDEDEKYIHFKFLGGTVFCLFYTFSRFRRAYIVTCWENEKDGQAITLPSVNEKLCLIFTARGRKIDHLKRCLYLLTRENENAVYSLPLIFWYKLAGLIQYSEAKKSDVMTLFDKYKNHAGVYE